MKYGPDEIVACSFTKAAAVELTGRDVRLAAGNVGTIHSLCYHAIGSPPILEGQRDLAEEWNTRYPRWKISKGMDLDEEHVVCDELAVWNRERATLMNRHLNPYFVEAWEGFKAETGSIDFMDMLLQAPADLGVKVLFVDEAQDLSPLQWKIVREWGRHVETFVVCGDDDQLLYQFIGAEAESFLTPIAPEHKRVLSKSYRVPRAVWEFAQAWISRLGAEREPKAYEPRDGDDGLLVRSDLHLGVPRDIAKALAGHAQRGESVMVLASCGFMLAPIIGELRRIGVPFHNPYRLKRGDWNPLRTSGKRLGEFVQCYHKLEDAGRLYGKDVWAWLEMLASDGVLKRGAKKAARIAAKDGAYVDIDTLAEWWTDELLDAIERQDTAWLRAHSTGRYQKALEFPCAIYEQMGMAGLLDEPAVVVGTVHSVKGGQAGTVYLFPDLSQQAWAALANAEATQDAALLRMFYVGMTRARDELVLCSPRGGMFYPWG